MECGSPLPLFGTSRNIAIPFRLLHLPGNSACVAEKAGEGSSTPKYSSLPVPDPVSQFQSLLKADVPHLSLAPMQDVTDLPFMRLMHRYGGPDVFFTEYFRVHADSVLEKWITPSITENDTGIPVVAQMIGNHIPSLVRTAKQLEKLNVAGIDLNLGCPAPVVYKKCAGGGLLREPKRVDGILEALRDNVTTHFTVKTRIGFADASVWDEMLEVFARHKIDLLTVHGRTVKEMYRTEVHYDYIKMAVDALSCPVAANGNVYSAQKAADVISETGAAGLMIGRGAIRNPWLFSQIRDHREGRPAFVPSGRDVLGYIRDLYESVKPDHLIEEKYVQKMKKYMNFIGIGIEPTGEFLHQIRRANTEKGFFEICESFLDHDEPTPLEPFTPPLPKSDVMAGTHR